MSGLSRAEPSRARALVLSLTWLNCVEKTIPVWRYRYPYGLFAQNRDRIQFGQNHSKQTSNLDWTGTQYSSIQLNCIKLHPIQFSISISYIQPTEPWCNQRTWTEQNGSAKLHLHLHLQTLHTSANLFYQKYQGWCWLNMKELFVYVYIVDVLFISSLFILFLFLHFLILYLLFLSTFLFFSDGHSHLHSYTLTVAVSECETQWSACSALHLLVILIPPFSDIFDLIFPKRPFLLGYFTNIPLLYTPGTLFDSIRFNWIQLVWLVGVD